MDYQRIRRKLCLLNGTVKQRLSFPGHVIRNKELGYELLAAMAYGKRKYGWSKMRRDSVLLGKLERHKTTKTGEESEDDNKLSIICFAESFKDVLKTSTLHLQLHTNFKLIAQPNMTKKFIHFWNLFIHIIFKSLTTVFDLFNLSLGPNVILNMSFTSRKNGNYECLKLSVVNNSPNMVL